MVTFDFFDYGKNPIVNYCMSHNKNLEVYTLDDMMPYIEKLPHSKKCLDMGINVSIGNQLRLYLSTLEDDFLYVDADCLLPEESINEIKSYKNCVYFNPKINKIENGTFFHSDKDCRFNKFYFDKYTELAKEPGFKKINMFSTFPFERTVDSTMSGDMKLIKPGVKHFFVSNFYKFKKAFPETDTVRYHFGRVEPRTTGVFWQLNNTLEDIYGLSNKIRKIYFFDTVCPYISQDDMFNLWKEQMNYTFQKKLKFERI